jgi:hypothetical protein
LWVLVGLALLAFAVRLTPLLIGGGLGGYGRYDDGVYYAAATAFTFGRLPYRDFILLHPPGLMLVLAPFAVLGRLTTDHDGMAVARLAFMGVGAVNAVLVAVVATRLRGRAAGVVAGLVYACSNAAVYSEQLTLLEPLGTTALLVALLLLTGPRSHRGWVAVAAGGVLGAAATLKIWYVVPWLVVVGWQLMVRRRRAAATVAGAGAVAVAAVTLPFLVAAPARMWDLVIRDQVLRSSGSSPRLDRLPSITGLRGVVVASTPALAAACAVALLVLVVAAILCVRAGERERVLVALLGANLLVLLASPSYFAHYAHLAAAPAALVLGCAAALVLQRHAAVLRRVSIAVVAGLCLASAGRIMSMPQERPVDGARLAAAVPSGCVASDTPELLIQMNRLSSDLRRHCRVLIDVSGITYDSLRRTTPNGRPLSRPRNLAYQDYLESYLLSARAFVVGRGAGQISLAVERRLDAQPALARSHALVLRAGHGWRRLMWTFGTGR